MGFHYVPQAYLRGFSEPGNPGIVWQYDKEKRRFSRASVSKVAQQRGFYSPEVETQLSALVEGPANLALRKVRRKEMLEEKDRARLALYIGSMIKRVPRSRLKALELLPEAIEEAADEVKAQIEELARTKKVDESIVARRLAEVEEFRRGSRQSPSVEVLDQACVPWPSNEMVALIYEMTWRFLPSNGPSYFLTSDNPAYFFEAYGLKQPEAELAFPISSDLALVGNWQQGEDVYVSNSRQTLVREVNRRVASGATRFLFYREREEWVARLALKERPALNRIVWQ